MKRSRFVIRIKTFMPLEFHRGKRDGLSKEGSGRVAIYKAIGLIKCYTLEGNYNTGKYVNELPPRGKEISAKKTPAVPPKYTPAIYEEVSAAYPLTHRFELAQNVFLRFSGGTCTSTVDFGLDWFEPVDANTKLRIS